ncbi:MAG: tRNA (adenosine(37)-N6)-threonylcarbamoyltransferase complex dimerization subunit type 1 TsaB [Candidatus Berkelbacteria bacterium]|nr:tRNA (adenosine(37)-N6)-threonylcarbamoyltransferase complex dimerization subunit type 1 TsaB [Candidatus Berkelbacteria bacterium]
MSGKSISENCLLYIDTSGKLAQVVLISGGKVIAEKSWNGFGDLSETLLVEIEKLLVANKLKFNDLGQIAVNPGPGSYTGVRIGVTTANFLAWSLNIPIAAGPKLSTVGRKIVNKKLQVREMQNQQFVLPKYSTGPNITKSKAGRGI